MWAVPLVLPALAGKTPRFSGLRFRPGPDGRAGPEDLPLPAVVSFFF
jgi:hypothetical protein